MKPQLSRREFFQALVPSWATKRNLITGTKVVGVALAVAGVITLVREVGLISLVKALTVGLGVLCVMAALSWIGLKLQYAFTIVPPFAQALIVVVLRFAGGLLLCAAGIHAYDRWRATGDMIQPLITICLIFVAAFIEEWRKRRASQSTVPQSEAPPSSLT